MKRGQVIKQVMKKGNIIKSKRSQVAVFVMLAIVVLAVVVPIVYVSKSRIESNLAKKYFSQSNIRPQLENVQDEILVCMDDTTRNALELIGIQGGFYNEPQYFYDLGWAFLPYYYYEGITLMPTKAMVENELSDYINENFPECLSEISVKDFSLGLKDMKTKTVINKGKVLFEIDAPVNIEREDNKIKFETIEHPIEQESKLYEILEVAKYITESHNEDPDMICINCVADLAREREVYVDMLDFADEITTLVIISENKTNIEPYIFEFLNKYAEITEEEFPADFVLE